MLRESEWERALRRFWRGVLPTACAAALAILGGASPTTAENAQEARARLAEIRRTVTDPGGFYSVSATLAELDKIEQKVSTGDLRARGEVNYLRGFVLYRAGGPKESLPPSREAFRIDSAVPFLATGERTPLLYSIAEQAAKLDDWGIAIDAYRKVIPLLDANPEIPQQERLWAREQLAYCLHEAGSFAEALTVNKEALAEGEKLSGPDSDKLLIVLTNLAQNNYALGDKASARRLLERVLSIATKHRNTKHLDNSLFQLSALSFDEGRPAEAEKFMKERLAQARKSGDPAWIKDAQEDLAMLHEKMRRR